MLDWNPALYSRYEDERTRPARDLLARVPLAQAARVVDLGCGPGNSTELLVQRFPAAAVTKFERAGAHRIYDGGNIVVDDLRGVSDATPLP